MPQTQDKNQLNDEERFLLQPLRDALVAAQTIIDELNSFTVEPGSELEADDKASPRTTISSQAISCLGHAADNLLAIKIMVFDAGSIPSFAAVSLVRSALESIGVALWIIGPGIRDTRVLRTLKTDYESHTDQLQLLALTEKKKYVAPKPGDPIYERFTEIKDLRSGNLKASFSSIPSITDRLKKAVQYTSPPSSDIPLNLYYLWNLTSGFTHGRRDALFNFLDKEIVGTHDGGFTAELTTPITLLHPLCKFAVDYLEEAMALLRKRNSTQE